MDLKCALQTGELEVCICFVYVFTILLKLTGCVVFFISLRQMLADLLD